MGKAFCARPKALCSPLAEQRPEPPECFDAPADSPDLHGFARRHGDFGQRASVPDDGHAAHAIARRDRCRKRFGKVGDEPDVLLLALSDQQREVAQQRQAHARLCPAGHRQLAAHPGTGPGDGVEAVVCEAVIEHVTKDGTLAGPKVLEHLVDVVLNFEGDRYGGFKTVRAVKNRFGSTSEVAIFEMNEEGLKEVENPSATLLAERTNTDGSIILATLEGTRPILVEIQALVNKTNFGYPKRTASGFDLNRLNLLIAVLERRTKLRLSESDIFINVVGGLKIQDSAADLAVCMAIASAVAGRKLNEKYVVFGEIGLGGEIRSAFRPDQRINEAKKLGFKNAIAPATVRDPFVLPVKDLRSALIKYMEK